MTIKYVPLKTLSPLLEFSYVGVIPYVIINDIAYSFLGVTGKIAKMA